MRDIQNHTSSVSYREATVYEKAYDGQPVNIQPPRFYEHQNIFAARDEIRQSNHTTPTSYSCYRYRCRPNNYRMLYAKRRAYVWGKGGWQWAWNEQVGKQALGWATLSNLGTNSAQHYALENKCFQYIMGQIDDKQIDFGEATAEIKQSANLVYETLRNICYAIAALKRGKLKEALDALGFDKPIDNLIDDYLIFIFAVRPLIDIAFNGVEELKRVINRQETYLAFTAEYKEKMYGHYNPLMGYYCPNPEGVERGAKCSVRYRIADSNLHNINSLGYANPALIAWNLTTLSFVIDWVFSVGSVINALSTPMGLQFVDGYSTFWTKGRYTLESTARPSGWESGYPSWEIECDVFRRRANFSFPRLRLTFTPWLSETKVLTSLALILQRAK